MPDLTPEQRTEAAARLRWNFLHEGEPTAQYGDGSEIRFSDDLRAVLAELDALRAGLDAERTTT
jgi:hypothetical protein